MDLYDLISRIKAAETDADSVAILEEELIRFIEEAKPGTCLSSDVPMTDLDYIKYEWYCNGVDEYQSNLLKLLTKEVINE